MCDSVCFLHYQVCIADINDDLGQQTLQELQKQFGDHVIYVKCDVTKIEDIKSTLYFYSIMIIMLLKCCWCYAL